MNYWLVVSAPLKNISSSVRVMNFPTEWKVTKFIDTLWLFNIAMENG